MKNDVDVDVEIERDGFQREMRQQFGRSEAPSPFQHKHSIQRLRYSQLHINNGIVNPSSCFVNLLLLVPKQVWRFEMSIIPLWPLLQTETVAELQWLAPQQETSARVVLSEKFDETSLEPPTAELTEVSPLLAFRIPYFHSPLWF